MPGRRRHLLLLGGAGRMGRLLGRFFSRRGFLVSSVDPAGVPRGFRRGAVEEAANADVVVVASSLASSAEAMGTVLARRPRGLVFDVASVKGPLVPLLRKAASDGISACSVHPMFGPSVRSFSGRDLVVCDAGDARAAARARRLFDGAGLSIRTMPLEEHDAWIASTLGLAHVVALAAASTLGALHVPRHDVRGRASTSFRHLLALVEPILSQPPGLTHAIQELNPHTPLVLARLSREVEAWRRAVAEPSGEAFARMVASASRARVPDGRR